CIALHALDWKQSSAHACKQQLQMLVTDDVIKKNSHLTLSVQKRKLNFNFYKILFFNFNLL
ncbi:hypothetical protein QU786_25755, partial [Escherichia coli]|nr:hypothetical protein [Escherichia coli]